MVPVMWLLRLNEPGNQQPGANGTVCQNVTQTDDTADIGAIFDVEGITVAKVLTLQLSEENNVSVVQQRLKK